MERNPDDKLCVADGKMGNVDLVTDVTLHMEMMNSDSCPLDRMEVVVEEEEEDEDTTTTIEMMDMAVVEGIMVVVGTMEVEE